MDKQNVVIAYNGILFKLEGNLTHAATCMTHEDIMLSELSQSQKGEY